MQYTDSEIKYLIDVKAKQKELVFLVYAHRFDHFPLCHLDTQSLDFCFAKLNLIFKLKMA